jgi:hypothetical protein
MPSQCRTIAVFHPIVNDASPVVMSDDCGSIITTFVEHVLNRADAAAELCRKMSSQCDAAGEFDSLICVEAAVAAPLVVAVHV